MWHEEELKLIDEIKIGKKSAPGIHMQLLESLKGKRYIKLWSTLSKEWRTMYRYDVDENWIKWKKTAERIGKK